MPVAKAYPEACTANANLPNVDRQLIHKSHSSPLHSSCLLCMDPWCVCSLWHIKSNNQREIKKKNILVLKANYNE